MHVSRRELLASLPLLGAGTALAQRQPVLKLSHFSAEITCPIGHPCMGGGIAPAKTVLDPLFAHGLIFQGDAIGKPVVWLSLDWCEIRNGAYEAWRNGIAKAVGTDPVRVMLGCLHQHDAPIADLEAEELLIEHKAKGSICQLKFHAEAVERVAKAAAQALKTSEPITHFGTAQAEVQKVASNRRYVDRNGQVQYNRMSATRDAAIREADLGTIDPMLKMLSFWNGEKALAAISAYATHPMSYYGRGEVSADFVGLARKLHQADVPKVPQIYASGCSGNVTAGAFNDGSPMNRPVLAKRLHDAMKQAWASTFKIELKRVAFRSTPLKLEARTGKEFTREALLNKLKNDPRPFGQCLAALGLSWLQRVERGTPIDLPVLDFGSTVLSLFPAESYVEYQLFAQQLRPRDFVLVAGYGECGPGYIPIERAWKENDGNLSDWCWVNPGSEERYQRAITRAFQG